MLESEYKRKIRDELKLIGAKTIPLITGQLNSRGEPDILGALQGLCFVVEAKVGRNTVSYIQKERLEQWQTAGALVFVVTYPEHQPVMVARMIHDTVEASITGARLYGQSPFGSAKDGSGNGQDENSVGVHS